jgi:flagellar hook assembly protein FlgD
LVVYNVLGQRVATLVNKIQNPGRHRVEWGGKADTGNDVASGVYFYVIISGEFKMAKKMVLLK